MLTTLARTLQLFLFLLALCYLLFAARVVESVAKIPH